MSDRLESFFLSPDGAKRTVLSCLSVFAVAEAKRRWRREPLWTSGSAKP
ncbi:hypothetical protein [uncultured Desulfovibrio sp.]|nr:hypothetical protein [uncultured Desulfovibrio sp.]